MSSTPATPSRTPRYSKSGVVLAFALLSFFLAVGVLGTLGIFSTDLPLAPRVLLALIALIGLGIPTWAFALCFRRYVRTGHWLADAEERRANAAKFLAREASPFRRRFSIAQWAVLSLIWLALGSYWIEKVIAHPQKLPWAAFWIVLCSVNAVSTFRHFLKSLTPTPTA